MYMYMYVYMYMCKPHLKPFVQLSYTGYLSTEYWLDMPHYCTSMCAHCSLPVAWLPCSIQSQHAETLESVQGQCTSLQTELGKRSYSVGPFSSCCATVNSLPSLTSSPLLSPIPPSHRPFSSPLPYPEKVQQNARETQALLKSQLLSMEASSREKLVRY